MRLPAEWEEQEFVQLVFPHKDTDWNEYLSDASKIICVMTKLRKEAGIENIA